MIDGATRLVGLIGWPVDQSVSPAMHNAAFDTLGLNWRYVPLPVIPEEGATSIRGLAVLGFAGANVTVPHKRLVMDTLDVVTSDAEAIGAVNTIVIERGDPTAVTHGHNTDWIGFTDSLRRAGFDPSGENAVVVGAGGSARAVVFGLLHAGADRVHVLSRRLEEAECLAADLLENESDRTRICPGLLSDELLIERTRAAALLVHATPVGMWPNAAASIWPEPVSLPADIFVYDLVYIPRKTRLLEQADRSGAASLGGLDMLVGQGARAFVLWTGVDAPIEVMREACDCELRRRSG